MSSIYLDYNATTPVHAEVLKAMEPFFSTVYGNPSSPHDFGKQARDAVERARTQVAALLDCDPSEVVFTSGGSESNNQAIKGTAQACSEKGKHLITSLIEHPAVIKVCRFLETRGFEVTYLPVDATGLLDPGVVEAAIRPDTILITVMHANNEVGTIEPVSEIGRIARARGVLLHSDAAQSCGKIPVHVDELGVDLLSLAGHKLYAPKGIGALYVRQGIEPIPLIHGAPHESGRRAGTENVPYIVGLGRACELLSQHLGENLEHMLRLRNRLHEGLEAKIPGIRLNGHPDARLPNTLSLSFPGLTAPDLMGALQDVALSAGAACHSEGIEPSPVLNAMGVSREAATGTLRFSTGKFLTEEEVDLAVERVVHAVEHLRSSRKR